MASEAMRNVVAIIEANAQRRPSSVEFEMAYQARVAIDKIKFAIKHAEQFAPRTDAMKEAALQLLDALERLESADRRFQQRSRYERCSTTSGSDGLLAHFTRNGAALNSRMGNRRKELEYELGVCWSTTSVSDAN